MAWVHKAPAPGPGPVSPGPPRDRELEQEQEQEDGERDGPLLRPRRRGKAPRLPTTVRRLRPMVRCPMVPPPTALPRRDTGRRGMRVPGVAVRDPLDLGRRLQLRLRLRMPGIIPAERVGTGTDMGKDTGVVRMVGMGMRRGRGAVRVRALGRGRGIQDPRQDRDRLDRPCTIPRVGTMPSGAVIPITPILTARMATAAEGVEVGAGAGAGAEAVVADRVPHSGTEPVNKWPATHL
jgi:hypothetical protein